MTLTGILFAVYIISSSAELYTCKRKGYNHFHVSGTALGGWLVLEPWITPSLFYQFIGQTKGNDVGMDSSSFCTALGKEEANRQLRRHWSSWVTEDIIANLAQSGATTIRIPVGDWMYEPYEPYMGCWDGALDELDRAIELCGKNGMTVLIDVHAMKDSQHGFDNSGITDRQHWDSNSSFKHWGLQDGDWIGHFNLTSGSYSTVNRIKIVHGLTVVQDIVDMYKDNPVVVGIEPVNVPREPIPIELLKKFYWYSYMIVQQSAPAWITLFHDSYSLTEDTWGDFLTNCPNYAFDTHIYQDSTDAADAAWFQEDSCSYGDQLRKVEAAGIPVVVGEWSLATDNCAKRLNGFNNNAKGYPKVQCNMVRCPDPYMGEEQPIFPSDPSKIHQGPLDGVSLPAYGTCQTDKPFPNEDEAMRNIALAKMNSFDRLTHGQFYWNFRTELESRWDYQQVVARGWLPSREDMRQRSGKVQRAITNSCAQAARTGKSSGDDWSAGLIAVTVISIVLLLGLICAIGVFAAKASGHDLSFLNNWWYAIRAQAEGYSAISRPPVCHRGGGGYQDVELMQGQSKW